MSGKRGAVELVLRGAVNVNRVIINEAGGVARDVLNGVGESMRTVMDTSGEIMRERDLAGLENYDGPTVSEWESYRYEIANPAVQAVLDNEFVAMRVAVTLDTLKNGVPLSMAPIVASNLSKAKDEGVEFDRVRLMRVYTDLSDYWKNGVKAALIYPAVLYPLVDIVRSLSTTEEFISITVIFLSFLLFILPLVLSTSFVKQLIERSKRENMMPYVRIIELLTAYDFELRNNPDYLDSPNSGVDYIIEAIDNIAELVGRLDKAKSRLRLLMASFKARKGDADLEGELEATRNEIIKLQAEIEVMEGLGGEDLTRRIQYAASLACMQDELSDVGVEVTEDVSAQ